jgi:hypothetical protein
MKFAKLLTLMALFLFAACSSAADTTEQVASATLTVTVEPTLAIVATDTLAPAATETAVTEQAIPDTPSPATATEIVPPQPTPDPTGAPPATRTQPPAVAFGRTDDGAFFHGSPDAPVTLIDYSDFL